MKTYIIEDTVYIGPFPKDQIINNFHMILQSMIKKLKEKNIDLSSTAVDIAVIFDNKWEKYYVGLFSEYLDIDEKIAFLIDILRMSKLIRKDTIRQKEKISLEGIISIYTEDFIEIEHKNVERDLEILDNKLKVYEKFEDVIDKGLIKIIYWLDEYDRKSYLDFYITLKIDLSRLKPVFNRLIKVTNNIKEVEKDGKISMPPIKPIEKPYDIELNLLRILDKWKDEMLRTKDELSDKEYLDLVNELLNIYSSLHHIYLYPLQIKIDKLKEIDIDSLTTLLHRISDLCDFDIYISNILEITEIIPGILSRIFTYLEKHKDKSTLNTIDKVLVTLNDISLSIYIVRSVATEAYKYEHHIYSRRELREIIDEFQESIVKLLKSISKIISNISINDILEYLNETNEFYDYIAYPIIEKLINEREKVLNIKEYDVPRILVKLINNVYLLKFLPGVERIYEKTPNIYDLIKTYHDLFDPSLIEKLDDKDLKKLIKYYTEYLPRDFIEKASIKLYNNIIYKYKKLLREKKIEEFIEELNKEPYIVGEKILDKLLWPYLKKTINDLARRNTEEAIKYIDNILKLEQLKFTTRDSIKGKLRSKLIGKKLALLKK